MSKLNPLPTTFAILALTANYQGASPGVEPHAIMSSKPRPHTYNLNIYAAFFPNGDGAAGAVICNHQGEVVARGCLPMLNSGGCHS